MFYNYQEICFICSQVVIDRFGFASEKIPEGVKQAEAFLLL